MPRPRRRRRVSFEPETTHYKPAGVRLVEIEEVNLTIDELEALRLKDAEGMGQKDAAEQMEISQPTFHRLLAGAREKVAKALVQGKALRIKGGNYKMIRGKRGRSYGSPTHTCKCPECGHEETKKPGTPRCLDRKCPECGARMIRGE